jgi:multidrug efflux pump subunit AcrB
MSRGFLASSPLVAATVGAAAGPAAATSRMVPLPLAAIPTVLGMIPIAPTVFWGPMAFAIMGGLMAATRFTLVLLPAPYVTLFGNEEPPATRLSAEAA